MAAQIEKQDANSGRRSAKQNGCRRIWPCRLTLRSRQARQTIPRDGKAKAQFEKMRIAKDPDSSGLKSVRKDPLGERAEANPSIFTTKPRFCASSKGSEFETSSDRFADSKQEEASVLGGKLRFWCRFRMQKAKQRATVEVLKPLGANASGKDRVFASGQNLCSQVEVKS